MHRRQHASYAIGAGIIRNGTVGNREMGFFDKSVTIDFHHEIIIPGGWTSVKRRMDQWLEHVPDLFPALVDRLSEGMRMLGTENRPIRIIIYRDVLRAPPEQEGKTVRKKNIDQCAQGRGAKIEWHRSVSSTSRTRGCARPFLLRLSTIQRWSAALPDFFLMGPPQQPR